MKLPVCFLNLGGISNITIVKNNDNFSELISKNQNFRRMVEITNEN